VTVPPAGIGRDGHLTALGFDRLCFDPADSAGFSQLQEHVDGCEACAAALAEVRAFDAAVTIKPPVVASPTGIGRDGHLTELGVDRLLYDPADAPGNPALAGHVDDCKPCTDRVKIVRDWDAEVSIKPPGREAPVAEIVSLDRFRRARRWAGPGVLLLAAVLAMFFVRPQRDTVRIKGSFGVEFFVHDGADVRRVDTGDAVAAGERVGFRLAMKEAGHVMIVGVDGQGHVYVCHPQGGRGQSKRWAGAAEPVAIDEAMRFDAVPGYERLLAIRCDEPFGVGAFDKRLGELGRTLDADASLPTLIPGCAQRETVLRKSADGGGAR